MLSTCGGVCPMSDCGGGCGGAIPLAARFFACSALNARIFSMAARFLSSAAPAPPNAEEEPPDPEPPPRSKTKLTQGTKESRLHVQMHYMYYILLYIAAATAPGHFCDL